MKYSEGAIGRIFVLSLEDGEELPRAIEDFAAEKGISHGMCMLVGGIDDGGNIVVGPRDRDALPPDPILYKLTGVHEVAAAHVVEEFCFRADHDLDLLVGFELLGPRAKIAGEEDADQLVAEARRRVDGAEGVDRARGVAVQDGSEVVQMNNKH